MWNGFDPFMRRQPLRIHDDESDSDGLPPANLRITRDTSRPRTRHPTLPTTPNTGQPGQLPTHRLAK